MLSSVASHHFQDALTTTAGDDNAQREITVNLSTTLGTLSLMICFDPFAKRTASYPGLEAGAVD